MELSNLEPQTATHPFPTRCALCSPEHCPAQKQIWGCLTDCGVACDPRNCDWTCPRDPKLFWARWFEVGGWPPRQSNLLRAPSETALPRYLPQLHHASKFDGPFDLPWVALKASRVVSRLIGPQRRGVQQLQTPADLRAMFKLPANAKVVLVSVAKDRQLESYWEWRIAKNLARRLAELDIAAVTVPNFSYFPEAPSWHTLWNFHRMMRVAEELSEAGIGVIPHVSSLTPAHRRDWTQLLREQPQLSLVAREFQTGARQGNAGQTMLDEIRAMQEELGRPLHPILVGGARYYRAAQTRFANFTVVDSHPFMATVFRRKITMTDGQSFSAVEHKLPADTPLDVLWAQNYQTYRDGLEARMQRAPAGHSPPPKPICAQTLSLFE